MTASSFYQKLETRQITANSLLCVGLDPDLDKLPNTIKQNAESLSEKIFQFNKTIIDSTAEFASVFKPQSAFYEGMGTEGVTALIATVTYIQKTYPDIVTLLDAKRGDIGSTNKGYIQFAFEIVKADAVTVNPYLGQEAMQLFLDQKDKGIIILVKTSNPGSGELQDLKINPEQKLYQYVAEQAAKKWNTHHNVGLVVGATYPDELTDVRKLVGDDIPLLIPGLGAQGGTVKDTIGALNKDKRGAILSASRSILYASCEEDFAQAAAKEAKKLRDEINSYR